MSELRDPDLARRYLAQGLWLQCVLRPDGESARLALQQAHDLAASGQALLPPGAIADVSAILQNRSGGKWRTQGLALHAWPTALTRQYEDHVLGKFLADDLIERAADAIRALNPAERVRGVSFVLRQFQDRAQVEGVSLSPAILRSVLKTDLSEFLQQGFDSFDRHGAMPELLVQYESLVHAVRRLPELLDRVDVLALEQRTALAETREYIAHRQILQAAARLERDLPLRPVQPRPGRREVPTRVRDEDQYPVGGYTSISTRGSLESLLHSQLAYIEDGERPDLFDLKFVSDELFYYSRDENQFLRRRRVFAFVFDPSLVEARIKDAVLPYQRIVLCCAVVLAVIRKLSAWLSTDALRFELIFPLQNGVSPLAEEANLFKTLLADLRAIGVADVLQQNEFAEHLNAQARKAQVQVLQLGLRCEAVALDGPILTLWNVRQVVPQLIDAQGETATWNAEDDLGRWIEATHRLLELWV